MQSRWSGMNRGGGFSTGYKVYYAIEKKKKISYSLLFHHNTNIINYESTSTTGVIGVCAFCPVYIIL